MEPDTKLVWWTNEAEADAVNRDGMAKDYWPEYLKTEFQSRLGRVGRGRLWVSPEFSDVPNIPDEMFDTSAISRLAAISAGIVIYQRDLHNVDRLPGFVTDMELRPATQAAKDYIVKVSEELLSLLSNPNSVHLNMLRGIIAKPSARQIIHLYGGELLNELGKINEGGGDG